MLRLVLLCLGLLLVVPTARADAVADCNQAQDRDRCIRGCTLYIEQNQDPEGLAHAYHNRGVAHMQKGNLERAIADYNKVLELRPRFADAYYNRGLAYTRKGDSERAITDYTKAIENNPRDAGAYRNRGDSYRGKGDFLRAIADYTRAIELDPHDAALYNSRGLAYAGNGDYAYALADATKAATLALAASGSDTSKAKSAAKGRAP